MLGVRTVRLGDDHRDVLHSGCAARAPGHGAAARACASSSWRGHRGASCFTVGLFSADALLGAPMETVLEELPFSDDVRHALLDHGGHKGNCWRRSRPTRAAPSRLPAAGDDDAPSLGSAYRDAIEFADAAARDRGAPPRGHRARA